MRSILYVAMMAISFSAYGEDTSQEPVDPVQPVAVAGAAALAGAAAVNDVDVELVGGDSAAQSDSNSASLAGADSKSKSKAESGSTSTITNTYPRQVPPVFLPALMVSDCGAAGSAGASDKGGAGAFGIVWTTKRCYALRTAINFFAIGEYQTGCELLVWVNKKAFDEIGHAPDCALLAAGLHAESRASRDAFQRDMTIVPPENYATKEELDRAFKQSMKK